MIKHQTIALDQIPAAAKIIANRLKGGEVLALTGGLGAGKTTFAKALGRELGIKRPVTSPTFTLLNRFNAKLAGGRHVLLYHLDLYRTKNFHEAETLGLTEFWGQPQTITVIEWGDKIKRHWPAKTIHLKFSGR